ncbi:TlyA family RNA methyltransferase [Microvirga sp. W0021]|uniref:TlyA family RNA methyltransferase n=1 Tax=Hohaiivirga grylli TaxID=3133970 RepID=A0ABV0BH85_9HYPH
MIVRKRADVALVELGIFESRAKAQAAIAAGLVIVDGKPVKKPSEPIDMDAKITAQAAHPYVSRGGLKLKEALEVFKIDATDQVCIDIGASTGGFCQVLLEAGARRVYAVDVGHGQLHPTIANDHRIINLEGTDARKVDSTLVPEAIDLLVSDVSFISLKLVIPPVLPLLKAGAKLAVLVKPQFEAGRDHVKKGIVRDAAIHMAVCRDMEVFFTSLGLHVTGLVPSPIEGGDGNREFLLGAQVPVGA